MSQRIHHLLVSLLISCGGIAQADYKADIGYARLLGEQGANIPDGRGVLVTQAEAETRTGDPPVIVYLPNVNSGEFTGKIITDVTGANPVTAYSAHATGVGSLFYGNHSSITPAVDTINVYNAKKWLIGDYLHTSDSRSKPLEIPDRVASHSWVGNSNDDRVDLEIVKRVDWVVEHDEFIQSVGLTNGASTNSPLLSAAFNVIAVGVTDGVHGRSTPSLEAPYVAGRTRPDLVAPFASTSSSTPVISAAAALLVGVGHDAVWLSTDPAEVSTTNRAGGIIYNAERSEVVKAVLMAGADRVTNNTTNPDPATPADIVDYRADPANRSSNGLDVRFGAGQLNIYSSYHILSAGEQNSAEDFISGGGRIGPSGFDFDPSFGGKGAGGSSNITGSYAFSTAASPVLLTASLVWNIDVADGGSYDFPGAATLYDLDLRLYDETGNGHVLVAESASTIDSTENIWMQLDAGKDYLLEVVPKTGQAAFEWDYALAWQMLALVDTDSDSIPDVINREDDNEMVPDADDNGPPFANPDQPIVDGDGQDDAYDKDFDIAVDLTDDSGGGGGCTMRNNSSADSSWLLVVIGFGIGFVRQRPVKRSAGQHGEAEPAFFL